MVFDNHLDEPNRVSHTIASTKRFLSGTEWKMEFHSLCKDPMEAPHHDVRHRYGSVLRWIPCFRTLGKQHSLPCRHAANNHRLKWPASSSAEIAFTSESFLPSGPVIGCINSQCISPIMGSDRESGTEGVLKRSRQKDSWTDIGREAGGSRQFPAMTCCAQPVRSLS